ncbi:MAG: J domain-containing protein [Bacteroidetes bacterium]|nr:J domain-containing protein [Bacteroidota bacterium]
MKDYYRILEIHHEASLEVIKNTYRVLAAKYHPDKHVDKRKLWAAEQFREIAEAYEQLNDPTKRKEYDAEWQLTKPERKSAENKMDEEAYFYYRKGLDYFERAMGRRLLSTLIGLRVWDLKKALVNFRKVTESFPTSKYSEESAYHTLYTAMEVREYDGELLEQMENDFKHFLEYFSRSRWLDEIQLLYAKFLYLKRRSVQKSLQVLDEFITACTDSQLKREGEILLMMVQHAAKK